MELLRGNTKKVHRSCITTHLFSIFKIIFCSYLYLIVTIRISIASLSMRNFTPEGFR